jgi:WD40 repeat protein
VSPDGATIFTAGKTSSFSLWSSSVGQLLVDFPTEHGHYTWADFSADGRRLFCKDDSGIVHVYDAMQATRVTDGSSLNHATVRIAD